MYSQEGFFMSFNKTTTLFLFCIMTQNNIFTMITVGNPTIAHALVYMATETYYYFIAEKNRFTGLADVVTDNKNDEYKELEKHDDDIKIFEQEYQKREPGDKRHSYEIITNIYVLNSKKFSENFKENFRKMASYSPLRNWKNILLFGPFAPFVEWVGLQLLPATPIEMLSSTIFTESCAKNKDFLGYIGVGILFFYPIIWAFVLMYGSSYTLINFLPLLNQQNGIIKFNIPKEYYPLLTQGIFGGILHYLSDKKK